MRGITRAQRYVDLKMQAFKTRQEDREILGDICAAAFFFLLFFSDFIRRNIYLHFLDRGCYFHFLCNFFVCLFALLM